MLSSLQNINTLSEAVSASIQWTLVGTYRHSQQLCCQKSSYACIEKPEGQNGPIPPTTVYDDWVFLRAFKSRHWPNVTWIDYRAESKYCRNSDTLTVRLQTKRMWELVQVGRSSIIILILLCVHDTFKGFWTKSRSSRYSSKNIRKSYTSYRMLI